MKRLAWPLTCYLAMTLVVPLLNGSPFDVEHALTVLGTVTGLAVIALAAGRAFKGSPKGKTEAIS